MKSHRGGVLAGLALAPTLALFGPAMFLAAKTAPASDPPTFNRDVAPIIYDKCTRCHRPGEVAPFSLISYEDAKKRAAVIAAVTKNRTMPPWKPDPGPVPFINDGRLSDRDIATLQKWAAAGAPEGDPSQKPAPPQFSEGWSFGNPDEVVTMPEAVQIPADGPDVYRCFVLATNVPADRYVSAFEFRPGNRRVVHHAILFVDTTGVARKQDAATPEQGYPCVGAPGFAPFATLGIWAPGWPMPPLPAGTAKFIPKGSDVVVQIHYHPSGKTADDRSALGLKYTGKPQREIQTLYVYKRQMDIAAGDRHHTEVMTSVLPVDADLVSIGPHAHLICKDMVIEAFRPDGSVVRLVHIADWDFNWQGFYYYSQPIRLQRKTIIKLTYTYDNSESNPHQPSHPPQRMLYGERTTDEMELGILGLTPVRAADEANFSRLLLMVMLGQRMRAGQDVSELAQENPRLKFLVRVFDRNKDGQLDDAEREKLIAFLESTAMLLGSPYWLWIKVGSVVMGLGIVAGLVWIVMKIVRRRRAGAPAPQPMVGY